MYNPETAIAGRILLFKAHPDDEAMTLHAATVAEYALFVDATNGEAGKTFDGTRPCPC